MNSTKIESVLLGIILVCLCLLAWASVFVWHNMFCAVMFSAGIFVWMWGVEGAND